VRQRVRCREKKKKKTTTARLHHLGHGYANSTCEGAIPITLKMCLQRLCGNLLTFFFFVKKGKEITRYTNTDAHMKKKERKHMHIFFFKCHSEGELSPFRTHVLVKQQSRTLKRDCENVKQNNSKKKKTYRYLSQ
jgi:hypothetical protein